MSHTRRAFVATGLAAAFVALTATSVSAQQQTVKQRLCIRQMNKGAQLVAEAQGHTNRLCVKRAGTGIEPDVDACVVADPTNKVVRKKQATIRRENIRCLRSPEQYPDFGKTDSATVNSAAQGEEINLLESVMGSPAQPGIISCDLSRDGCRCQERIVRFYEKLMFRKIEGFRLCKKPGLRHGTIVSSADLENCLGQDPRGKVALRLLRLEERIQRSCVDNGINLGTAVPGSCAAAATALDLTVCLDVRTSCYSCRMLNAVDGLSKDCDLFDDGLANASCPP